MCPFSALTGVRILKRVEFRKMYGLSLGTKKTVRNNAVSVKRVSTVDDRRSHGNSNFWVNLQLL